MVLGASFDSQAENRAFREKCSFPFPLLCDSTRALGLAYGACDDAKAANARRAAVWIDPQGKVKKYWPKVDAKAFPQQVQDELAAQRGG